MKLPFNFLGEKDTYESNSGVYRAPISGYYSIKVEVTKLEKTGKQTLQEDFNRKWFQFWKPKMILKDEYTCIIEPMTYESKHLNQGDIVFSFTDKSKV